MTAPWVGAPSDEYRAVCLYSEKPGSPYCHDPATLHVKVEDATYGEVALATCDTHAPIARASGGSSRSTRTKASAGSPGRSGSTTAACSTSVDGHDRPVG